MGSVLRLAREEVKKKWNSAEHITHQFSAVVSAADLVKGDFQETLKDLGPINIDFTPSFFYVEDSLTGRALTA